MLCLRRVTPRYALGVWKLSESLPEIEAMLSSALVAEAGRRFKAPHRRLEWLAVRVLLFALLGDTKEVAYLPSGRPYLADGSMEISFTHTYGYVAVIIGHRRVGIDIEQYAPRVHRVASRFVRNDEMITAYQGDDTWSLLLHWSAKETVYKCIDIDGVDFREHLHVLPFTPQKEGSFTALEYRTPRRQSFTIHYLLCADFVLTFCEA